jgi:hypothetical protein
MKQSPKRSEWGYFDDQLHDFGKTQISYSDETFRVYVEGLIGDDIFETNAYDKWVGVAIRFMY